MSTAAAWLGAWLVLAIVAGLALGRGIRIADLEEFPAVTPAERNARTRNVLELIDELAVTEGHAYRARVRVASLWPPTGPMPTDDDVRQAVADTAPPATEELVEC